RDPVADVSLGEELAVGLLEVEVTEGLSRSEHQVLVVGAAEVRSPVGRVVVRGAAVPDMVRLRDLIVHRPGRAKGLRVDLGAEVSEDREDRLLTLDGVLDELALPEVDDPLATLGLDLRGALDQLPRGLLP